MVQYVIPLVISIHQSIRACHLSLVLVILNGSIFSALSVVVQSNTAIRLFDDRLTEVKDKSKRYLGLRKGGRGRLIEVAA